MFIFIGLVIGAFWFGLLQGSPVFGGILGGVCGWVYQLMARVKKLEAAQLDLTQQFRVILQHQNMPSDAEAAEGTEGGAETLAPIIPPITPPTIPPEESEHSPAITHRVQPVQPAQSEHASTTAGPLSPAETQQSTVASEQQPQREGMAAFTASDAPKQAEATLQTLAAEAKSDVFSRGFSAAKDWLLGGNPFVRAGIVLLFIGFVFLMRYSLEKNLIPVEVRLLGSALGALALLGFGWKFRQRVGAYGLVLQAGGVALLYLTVFAAFSMYQLLPSVVAFPLLVLIVAAAVGLAVLQNSLPLAMFATAGGFMAPLLVSSGSNNYIGLFSFYALLNVGIVCIAWFKSWRLLNLLGFVFTFAIAAMWGWSSYQPANFSTVEPFLILFFLFYVAIAILFALRTPVNFKDKVDSTLLFGTPILGFSLQIALVQDFEFGIAISALVLGGFYLLLAMLMWQRFGKLQQLLCETFVVLGVIFTTLAIPFAVDGAMTAAAWAIEGAGVLWISIRQQQWLRRGVAVLLQYGALVSLLVAMVPYVPSWISSKVTEATPFINGEFIAGVLVSGALLLSSWLLGADFASKRRYEHVLSFVLLLSGLIFLTLCFEAQIVYFKLDEYFVALHLGYAVTVSVALLAVARCGAWPALSFALPLPVILMGLAGSAMLVQGDSLLSGMGLALWPLCFLAYYAVLLMYQRRQLFPAWLTVLQVITAWLLIVLLSYEVHFQMQLYLSDFKDFDGWYVASLPLVGIAAIWLMLKAKVWPLRDYVEVLLRYVALPLAGLLLCWALLSLRFSGGSEPLFWLPLLNPLDVVVLLLTMTLFQLYRRLTTGGQNIAGLTGGVIPSEHFSPLRLAGVGLGFIWLNILILRAMHHWYGLPWSISGLLSTPETQTVLAIVWTLSGLLLSWLGSRRGNRYLWFAGTALLGLVVLKLFVVDFASSGTLARIVSFLSVGVLLLFVGFLAPMPPARDEAESMDDRDGDIDNSNDPGAGDEQVRTVDKELPRG